MKEVTRAYETGDLARLIEIEQRWGASLRGRPGRRGGGSREVSRADRGRAQGPAARCLGRAPARRAAPSPSERLRTSAEWRRRASIPQRFVISAERDLDRLSDIKNCLHAFVAGRLSWDDLLSTPSWYADDDEFDPYFEE